MGKNKQVREEALIFTGNGKRHTTQLRQEAMARPDDKMDDKVDGSADRREGR